MDFVSLDILLVCISYFTATCQASYRSLYVCMYVHLVPFLLARSQLPNSSSVHLAPKINASLKVVS